MKNKPKMKSMALSILLTLAMVVGLMPGMGLTAYAEGTAVDISTLTVDYTATDGDVLSGTASGKTVTIPAGATVTLNGVNISNGSINCAGDATIILMGANTVTATATSEKAAIKIGGSGTTLTITGSGSLTAQGGSGSGIGGGAGIGMDYTNGGTLSGGNIVINGGTVIATGGRCGAGIGTGLAQGMPGLASITCGDITINGGTVIATGGQFAAGIGTGVSTGRNASNECGAITIGTGVISVTATKGSGAPNCIGIGDADTGTQTCGTITIDGVVNATTSSTFEHFNSAVSGNTWTLTIKAKDTQTITASDVTATYGDTDKNVSATTDGNGEISYAVKAGSENYIDVNASTGALTIKAVPADGKAYVIVTAAETSTYTQATKEVTVTINKANAVAATVTANNRTYDGTEKPLVTVTGTPTGGTMNYAIGSDATTAPTEGWGTSIPTATNAGTYYVWYKVVGDDNHNDSEPDFVAVTISHKYTEVAGVPATCTETGVKQHWKDEEGNLYKDAEGKGAVTEAELAIPALGHKYGAWTKLDDTQHQRVCEHDKTHVEKADHTWDSGKVTKEATTTAEGVKTFTCTVCKATKTESIPKLNPAPAPEKKVSTAKAVLAAKGIAKGKTAVNLSWNKVSGADRYVIYFARCNQKGRSYVLKKVKTVNGKTLKWSKGKLAKNTAYKFYVVAQKKSGKSYKNIAKSKVGHFYTGNVKGKYTNPKSLTLKKSAYTLKKGKTATIKASVSKVKTNKKLATSHAATYRYTSNNPAVATVNAKGKVTAKAKGTAVIYVQTINGIWKTCKVTVK